MAFNGAGVFVRLYSWVQDAANGIDIKAARVDAEDNGFATGLSTCITKDGQTTITANLPMATFKHTGVGNATAVNQYAAAGQVQNGAFIWLGSTSSTNTVTATATPTLTAYAAGQTFRFIIGGTNTTAVTLNIDGLGAKAVQKNQTALGAGDWTAGDIQQVTYDGTQFQLTSIARTPFIPTGSLALNTLVAGTHNVLIGNNNSGVPSEVTISTGLSLSGGILTASNAVPTGTILDFGGTVAPAGYLACDGTAVNRTTYATLFTAISTTWGAGDGSTTFNLPDFSRRVAVGSGGSGTGILGNAVGNTGGAETHTLSTGEIPAHHHTQQAYTTGSATARSPSLSASATLVSAGIDTADTGGGGAHNNMQPSAVVLKIIKT